MNKKHLKIGLGIIIGALLLWLIAKGVFWTKDYLERRAAQQAREQAISEVLMRRQANLENPDQDPFGEDNVTNVLLVGIDKRVGQTEGHCDAIQMIQIDREANTVDITAVPRGTYSPLPYGKATTSTDYYVSKSCELGGLEYGIAQIEKIARQDADYVVVVGFSEALGLFRALKLPTTETLQWLRHRQGYQIGEPQRARNHSTFIKTMMTRYIPTEFSGTDRVLHQIAHKTVQTDLSFAQTQTILDELSAMDLASNPDAISLHMRPAYSVQDIPFNENEIGEHVKSLIEPIKGWIPEHAYTGTQQSEIEAQLVQTIHDNQNDAEFVSWAYENNLWLQIEADQTREETHYLILQKYVTMVASPEDKEQLVADYIVEKQHLDLQEWVTKGEEFLLTIL